MNNIRNCINTINDQLDDNADVDTLRHSLNHLDQAIQNLQAHMNVDLTPVLNEFRNYSANLNVDYLSSDLALTLERLSREINRGGLNERSPNNK